MSIYFQHVGEKGGRRDFPRTIGTSVEGLKMFRLEDVEDLLDLPSVFVPGWNREQVANRDGFQIWGIPAGAKSVLREIKPGDWLALAESVGKEGSFYYLGKVIAIPPGAHSRLSSHLWGGGEIPANSIS